MEQRSARHPDMVEIAGSNSHRIATVLAGEYCDLRDGLERFQQGLISPTRWVQLPLPQLPLPSLSPVWPSTQTPVKRPGREPGDVIVGSTPTSATTDNPGLLSLGRRPGLQPGKSGFDSPAVHCSGGRKAAIRQLWKLENVGSIPTPLTAWAYGPTGRHQFGRLEIRVRFPVGPLIRRAAGYGLPGRFAKPCGREVMRVQLPRLPLFPSAECGTRRLTPLGSHRTDCFALGNALVVKGTSCLGPNEAFRVQVLAGVFASMVKRTSCQASNLAFRVRVLVEALCPWCSRLAHDVVTVEVVGSSPPGHPLRKG